jgi:hypothetical protein
MIVVYFQLLTNKPLKQHHEYYIEAKAEKSNSSSTKATAINTNEYCHCRCG